MTDAVDRLPGPVGWADNESVTQPVWRQAVTWTFVALVGFCFAAAAYLAVAEVQTGTGPDPGVMWLAGNFVFYLVGVVGYWRGICPLSVLLLGVGGAFGIGDAIGYAVRVAEQRGAEDGWLVIGVLGHQLAAMIGIVLLTRVIALLPDARYRYPHERMILRATWALPLLSVIIVFAGPTTYRDHAPFLGPLQSTPVSLPTVPWISGAIAVAYEYYWLTLLIGIALFVARAIRMEPGERRTLQTILMLLIVAVFVTLVAYQWLAQPAPVAQLLNGTSGLVAVLAIVGALAYSGVRHGVPGVGAVARRNLVYSVLWILIAGAYLGLAIALGLAATARLPVVIAILITVAATVVLEPVRRWVRRLAEQQVLGRRLTGYELLVRMGGTLEHAWRPKELADELASGLRDGLGLNWARVRLDQHTAVAGTVIGDPVVERPLQHNGVELGLISCGPKPDGAFAPRDLELIDTLARQAGLALHHARQTAELEASRARIVQAQDAERRRIEQDLHDGVQQELVAVVAKLGLARSVLRRDPGRSLVLIEELQDEAVRIVDEFRELAHGIHPSVLSDEGLVAAVESRARRMPIPAAVTAPDGLRDARFAIEVEASAYYFVSESLTNVLKHAGATKVAINLAATNGSLLVEVRDNGSGLPPAVRSGSGLTALRDRIEAVGGSLRVANGTGGGAAVHARLPSGAASG